MKNESLGVLSGCVLSHGVQQQSMTLPRHTAIVNRLRWEVASLSQNPCEQQDTLVLETGHLLFVPSHISHRFAFPLAALALGGM